VNNSDAIPASLLLLSAALRARVTLFFENILTAQKENLIVWVPIIMACGIGTYFGLRFEPPVSLTMGAAGLGVVLWVLAWPLRERALPVWIAVTILFLFVSGFAVAQIRTLHVASPMLQKEIKITRVKGTIAALEDMEEGTGQRYLLSDVELEKMPPEKTPHKVRLRVRTGDNPQLSAGDRVEVLAGLSPPSAPVAPGAFDFQRYAYFRQIGAFGYTYETPRIITEGPPRAFGEKIEQFREKIIARIRKSVPDASQSSIATAMMTGERSAISKADNEALQESGLAHMLSISGMHIGMISASVFFMVRILLVSVPAIALHFSTKKIAAFAALLAAISYLLVIGVDHVPAVRATMMTGLVLIAIMLDRMPFSMRTVGLAAFVTLMIWPDALWSASFQMSFSAVTALIYFYSVTKHLWARMHRDAGFVRKLALYMAGLCATSLVASLATAPFVLFHFQRASLYGIAGNLLGVPVLGFVVMPAVILSYVLIPFGWEGPALWAMGKGITFIMNVARDVAAIPGSNIYLPALPLSGFIWMTLGALILMLWRGRGKWVGILPLIVSAIIIMNVQQPDILISSKGKLIAYAPQGQKEKVMSVSSRVRDRFSIGVWAQRYGFTPDYKPATWPKEGADTSGLVCDEGGCRLEHNKRKIAFSFDPGTHREDCAWADIMIANDPVRGRCDAGLTIDFFDTWRNGAYAVWLDDRRFESVSRARGQRPWTISPRR